MWRPVAAVHVHVKLLFPGTGRCGHVSEGCFAFSILSDWKCVMGDWLYCKTSWGSLHTFAPEAWSKKVDLIHENQHPQPCLAWLLCSWLQSEWRCGVWYLSIQLLGDSPGREGPFYCFSLSRLTLENMCLFWLLLQISFIPTWKLHKSSLSNYCLCKGMFLHDCRMEVFGPQKAGG